MPYPKDNAKMTGDTHLPDVESDMLRRRLGRCRRDGRDTERPRPGH